MKEWNDWNGSSSKHLRQRGSVHVGITERRLSGIVPADTPPSSAGLAQTIHKLQLHIIRQPRYKSRHSIL